MDKNITLSKIESLERCTDRIKGKTLMKSSLRTAFLYLYFQLS